MPEPDIEARFTAARSIARKAGELALDYFANLESLSVESKGPQDMASEADHAVEALIRERLKKRFPADGLFGEEGGMDDLGGDEPGLWVIDPIDGTACFVAGIPVWCISIAFLVGDRVEIGVIFDPNADEMFTARHGHGAHLNGIPLKPSDATGFGDGMMGFGYSTRTEVRPVMAILETLLEAGGMFQRNGSGALMIAYVAAGRLIGYYEAHINAWDCLAAIVLVREAGGWTNDFLAGEGLGKGNPIAAAAPGMAAALKALTGLA